VMTKCKKVLTKDFLTENYINKKLTINQIANSTNFSEKTIRNYLKKYKIEINKVNLIGKTFGNLTVLSKDNSKIKIGNVYWLCQCKCGKIISRPTSRIQNAPLESACRRCFNLFINDKFCRTGYKDISGTYWKSIENSAIKRNIDFKLTIEEAYQKLVDQNFKCALSGVDIKITKYITIDKDLNASIDRIDSSKGYTLDNIQWVHKDINFMKNNHSDDKFINWCAKVIDYQRSKM